MRPVVVSEAVEVGTLHTADTPVDAVPVRATSWWPYTLGALQTEGNGAHPTCRTWAQMSAVYEVLRIVLRGTCALLHPVVVGLEHCCGAVPWGRETACLN